MFRFPTPIFAIAAIVLLSITFVQGGSWGLPYISKTYDYIIIGGGTSGLAIASRLAANSSISVAVVEAGGIYETDSPESIIPGAAGLIFTGSNPAMNLDPIIDWDFVTADQPGLNGRSIHYARGRTLGGSSARHFMVYHRADNGTFQRWADLVDDQSYTFSNLLPYFKKSCTLTAPDYTKRNTNSTVTYSTSGFDNSLSGPLHVSWPNWGAPFSTFVAKAFEIVGIPLAADVNSGSLLGYSWVSTTINPTAETRDSSKTSFLDTAFANTGITVYIRTLVKKILFTNTNQASGIQVSYLGIPYTLTATQEIILSAGAFQSPQLLMVSGIGPRDTLESLDIPVISELPGVGQNMWDHVMLGTTREVNVTTGTTLAGSLVVAASAAASYAKGEGPLTAPGFGVLSWEKLPPASRSSFSASTIETLATLPAEWPEVEYLALDGVLGNWSSAADQLVGGNKASIGTALVAPFSRGNITITSADTNDAPIINPNFLSHPTDVEVALAAFRRTREIWVNSGVGVTAAEYLPGLEVRTDEEVVGWIRANAVTVWHAAGTCKMGVETDGWAVVDSRARVLGVTGLRVVDASAFPVLPPGHPQSACYVLAEKIADDILEGR